MRPVFEHALVGALGLAQVAAPVVGNPGPQHVVMRALDDVDGVDLDIAEMFDRLPRGIRAVAEPFEQADTSTARR